MVGMPSSLPHTDVIELSISRSDGEIEAIYIKLKKAKVAKSVEVGTYGEAIVDLDKSGEVVGVEMLEPGNLTIRGFNKIKKQFNIPQLKHFNIDRLQEAFA